jgi:hypothetical protein
MGRLARNRYQQVYMKGYRQRNKDKFSMLRKARVNRRKLWVDRFKDKPCADCGIKYHPWQMDFDHLNPRLKAFVISQNMLTSLSVLKREIEKCEVVCANCHRQRTHDRKA